MNTEVTKRVREKATCRHCGKSLIGDAYQYGGHAHHPDKGGQVKTCHYGGFVCSVDCDYSTTLKLEGSMPGHNGQVALDFGMRESIRKKWVTP